VCSAAERDVVANGVLEHEGLLRHERGHLGDAAVAHRAQVDVVEQHLTGVGVDQAQQQVGEGRLAGAGRAHESDRRAGGHRDARDVADRRRELGATLGQVDLVGEVEPSRVLRPW
jgi:hypothetical protein